MAVWFTAPHGLCPPFWGMETDQVLLHQECGAERGNEFQEAEHANEFIIPAWFRSNYHFASKAIQDRVALVKLSQVWIQINICISANAQGGPLWQPEIGVAILDLVLVLLIATSRSWGAAGNGSDGLKASRFRIWWWELGLGNMTKDA